MPNHGTGQLNVSIDANLKKRFREVAKGNGTSATTLIQQWVQQYIDSNGKATNLTQPNLKPNLEAKNQTQHDLEERVAKLESTLKKIDEEGLTAILTAGNDIEHGNAIAQENRKDIADINHHLDEVIEDRIAKLEENKADRESITGIFCQLPEIKNRDRENPPPEMPQESTEEDKPEQLSLNEETATEEAKIDQSENEGQSESVSELQPLSQEALGERLNVRGQTVANQRKKGDQHLREWTKQRDPEGIAWKYENKKYRPVK